MPNKNESTFYYVLVGVLCVVAIGVWPFVLRSTWGWFLVPLGLKPIGYLHALGVHLTLKFFTWGYGESSPKKDSSSAAEIFTHQLGRLLGIGLMTGILYLIHLYAF